MLLYFLSVFLGVFTVAFVCLNIIYSKLRRPTVILLFTGMLLIGILSKDVLGEYATYIELAYILCILAFNKENVCLNCGLFLLGYLFEVTLNYICLLLILVVFHKNFADFTLVQSCLFYVFFFFLCYYITYFLGRWIKSKILPVTGLLKQKELSVFIFFYIGICACLFVFNFASSERLGYPKYLTYINCALFLIYFSLTAILLYIIIKSVKHEAEEKQKLAEYENLQEYTKKLEDLYQQMRTFKHDYINILTTMDCYIEQKDFDNLNKYFYSKILPTGKQFSKDSASLGRLANIQVLELKSILYQKFVEASALHLNLEIDIPEPLTCVTSINPLELARLMGIFLDNAIDATQETEVKKLFCGILKSGHEIIIVISNSCNEMNFPIETLYKEGFTTKSSGQGIGLYNVKQILNAYPDILHYTEYQNNIFTQELRIPIQSNES